MKQYRVDIALCLLIFVVALAMRVAVAAPVFAGDTRFITGDDDDYYGIAISLITHGTFASNGILTAYRMPLFPLFLALLHLIVGPQPYAPLPILLALGALIPVGTYLLGRGLADRVVGMIAGLLLAADQDLAFYSRLYMTEILFSVLVLASMLAASRLRTTRTWRWAVITGVALGCASMTRANFLPFVGILLLWLFWLGRDQLRVALRNATIIGMIIMALWLPWVVRNYLVFHQLIPFTTQAGNAYYGIYNDVSTSGKPNVPYGLWVWLIPHPPQVLGKVWDEVALDVYQRDLARQWISAHPAEARKVALMQMLYFWLGEDAGSYFRTVVLGVPALLVLTIYRRHPDVLLWLALALTMTFLALMTVGEARYAFPLRPILAVVTAMVFTTVAQVISGWCKRGVVAEEQA